MELPIEDLHASPTTSVKTEESFWDKIYRSLSANPYFSAGAGLMGVGAAAAISKRMLIVANAALRRRFLTAIEIDSTDSSYMWVLDYINRRSVHKTNKFTVNTWLNQSESGKTTTSCMLLPGRGTHYFWDKFHLFKVERNRENQSVQQHGVRTPLETVTLTTHRTRGDFWQDFISEASHEALSKVKTGLVLYHAVGPEWHRFGNPRPKRPLSSVILDECVSEKMQTDFEGFLAYEERRVFTENRITENYRELGIPYRRGYLFYGPPGTGKTSFILAMAGHYGYSICNLSLSEPTLDDGRLIRLLNTAPNNSFVLLEDIDAAMPNSVDPAAHIVERYQKAYEGISRVTFSGLLNAIDGATSADDRVLFMTTNHIERLDPALIRPGRVDVKQFFSKCTPKMLSAMFKRFYKDYTEVQPNLCEEFVEKAQKLNRTFSPAEVQGHLQMHRNDPRSAIENLQNLS